MAGSVNKVILIGNLGKDPEVKNFDNGGKIVNFSIATTETWKDKNGEKQSRTDWHNIVVNRPGLAGVAETYLRKGSQVYVEGRLRNRQYTTKEGETRYITEVQVEELTLLGSRPADNANSSGASSQSAAAPVESYESTVDDDLPF